MFLPLALIRNLQMHWKRKLTVGALFGLGWVCIATATIRAAYLGSDVAQRVAGGANFKVPSPPWLALWAMVEAAVGKCKHHTHYSEVLTRTLRQLSSSPADQAFIVKSRSSAVHARDTITAINTRLVADPTISRAGVVARDETHMTPLRTSIWETILVLRHGLSMRAVVKRSSSMVSLESSTRLWSRDRCW